MVAVLLIAGDQVPVTPFVEVVGKGAKRSPEQIGGIAGENTANNGFTIICTVLGKAHCSVLGVKV